VVFHPVGLENEEHVTLLIEISILLLTHGVIF